MLDALLWWLPLFGAGDAGPAIAPLTILASEVRDVSPTCELADCSPVVEITPLSPAPTVVPL